VRQVAHEADGVGEQHRLAAGKGEPTRGRIECGEQPVLGEHAGVGEQVEQRRLAGVGVAHDRHVGEPAAAAALALQFTGVGERRQVGLEFGDPAHDPPPIDLHPRLAATEAGADAAALLAQVGFLAASQPRQSIAQERQLDLSLALERVRVLAEDVEDHRSAVDRRATEQLLQVELLRRGQFVVEHHGVGVDGEAQLAQLLDLALADVPRVVGRLAALHDPTDDIGAGRVDEQLELVEAGVEGVVGGALQRHPDQDNLLPDAPVDERCAERFLVWGGHDVLDGLGIVTDAT
jgi:hypothetical protein